MTGWLHPLSEALDRASRPVTFFFRDDDGGWDDEALGRLLERFAESAVALDVAVIPTALGLRTARELLRGAGGARVRVHQHGYAHANHEPAGRKCEFGPSRPLAFQHRDIAAGQTMLRAVFGAQLDPIFTPPWNRCVPETGELLRELGFAVLSRDRSAGSLQRAPLRELPIHVDWFAKDHGQRSSFDALGVELAAAAGSGEPLGVMLHHAVMDAPEHRALGELLALVASHRNARPVSMWSAARLEAPASP